MSEPQKGVLVICSNPFDMSKPPKVIFDDKNYSVIAIDTAIEDKAFGARKE